jgi:hypothetical protein
MPKTTSLQEILVDQLKDLYSAETNYQGSPQDGQSRHFARIEAMIFSFLAH